MILGRPRRARPTFLSHLARPSPHSIASRNIFPRSHDLSSLILDLVSSFSPRPNYPMGLLGKLVAGKDVDRSHPEPLVVHKPRAGSPGRRRLPETSL